MKALTIIFIVLGIPVFISGFIDLSASAGGDFLGFPIDSPWYGVIHIAMGAGMLYGAYDAYRKKK